MTKTMIRSHNLQLSSGLRLDPTTYLLHRSNILLRTALFSMFYFACLPDELEGLKDKGIRRSTTLIILDKGRAFRTVVYRKMTLKVAF